LSTRHEVLTDDLREQAALYSLGLMTSEGILEFTQHLEQGCAICAEEVRAMDEIAAGLSINVPAAVPPASLRQRVLNGTQPQYLLARAGDGAWKPFAAPGISIRPLADDANAGTRSFLLRFAPKAVLPAHQHEYAEHCYVLEGDVHDDDHSLHAGDYELRLPGSPHAPITSENGAIVLIIAGRHRG